MIAERDSTITQLNAEIQRLNAIIEKNGMKAGDLQNQMAELMQKLSIAEG